MSHGVAVGLLSVFFLAAGLAGFAVFIGLLLIPAKPDAALRRALVQVVFNLRPD
jgi:hypothetical protein